MPRCLSNFRAIRSYYPISRLRDFGGKTYPNDNTHGWFTPWLIIHDPWKITNAYDQSIVHKESTKSMNKWTPMAVSGATCVWVVLVILITWFLAVWDTIDCYPVHGSPDKTRCLVCKRFSVYWYDDVITSKWVPHYWPFVRESTGHREFSLKKGLQQIPLFWGTRDRVGSSVTTCTYNRHGNYIWNIFPWLGARL